MFFLVDMKIPMMSRTSNFWDPNPRERSAEFDMDSIVYLNNEVIVSKICETAGDWKLYSLMHIAEVNNKKSQKWGA